MPIYIFECKDCGEIFRGRFKFYQYQGEGVSCPECKSGNVRREYRRESPPSVHGGPTKAQPAAYYKHDKTGEMIPVDKQGKIIDNDPYYKKGDPRGWKRAGKSTKGYEREVHWDGDENKFK